MRTTATGPGAASPGPTRGHGRRRMMQPGREGAREAGRDRAPPEPRQSGIGRRGARPGPHLPSGGLPASTVRLSAAIPAASAGIEGSSGAGRAALPARQGSARPGRTRPGAWKASVTSAGEAVEVAEWGVRVPSVSLRRRSIPLGAAAARRPYGALPAAPAEPWGAAGMRDGSEGRLGEAALPLSKPDVRASLLTAAPAEPSPGLSGGCLPKPLAGYLAAAVEMLPAPFLCVMIQTNRAALHALTRLSTVASLLWFCGMSLVKLLTIVRILQRVKGVLEYPAWEGTRKDH